MIKIGRFVVISGEEAKVRPTHEAYWHWIVTDDRGMVYGHYASEFLAMNLAEGLHKSEIKRLDEEMENMLVRKP